MNPWIEATKAMEEFGRVASRLAKDAEAELERRGIPRDNAVDPMPALDQLAAIEREESR